MTLALLLAGTSLVSAVAGYTVATRISRARVRELEADRDRLQELFARSIEDNEASEEVIDALHEERAELLKEVEKYRPKVGLLHVN